MGLAQVLVKLQSFAQGLLRFDRLGEVIVTIAQCCISQGVVRIVTDSLLVVFDSFLHALDRKLVKVVATLEIKLISLGAFGVPSGQSFLIFTGQLQAQLVSDLAGDCFLHREKIRRVSNVLRAPNVGVVTRIDQFSADRK